MSRIEGLVTNDQDVEVKIVIGWDHPLQTYYGQVHFPNVEEDENPVIWVGVWGRELYEVEELVKAMPNYCREFINKNGLQLYGDKDEGR